MKFKDIQHGYPFHYYGRLHIKKSDFWALQCSSGAEMQFMPDSPVTSLPPQTIKAPKLSDFDNLKLKYQEAFELLPPEAKEYMKSVYDADDLLALEYRIKQCVSLSKYTNFDFLKIRWGE